MAEPSASPETGGAAVTRLAPATRFVLRLSPEDAAAAGVAGGFGLQGAMNHATGTSERFAARLGPDEWLLVASEAEAPAISADLKGRFHSLVDVSHRNMAFAVAGPAACEILNAGVPLDLNGAVFPVGAATRTVLGKAEIVLTRWEEGFRVECWRSFAPYVHAFLLEAARRCHPG